MQNGVGWTTSSSSGPQPLTAGILPEIAEATAVAEAATIAEAAAVAEAATVAEAAAIQEAATVAEAAVPEDRRVAEDRSIPEMPSPGTPTLRKSWAGFVVISSAKLGETSRPILQIAHGKRVVRHCGCFGD